METKFWRTSHAICSFFAQQIWWFPGGSPDPERYQGSARPSGIPQEPPSSPQWGQRLPQETQKSHPGLPRVAQSLTPSESRGNMEHPKSNLIFWKPPKGFHSIPAIFENLVTFYLFALAGRPLACQATRNRWPFFILCCCAVILRFKITDIFYILISLLFLVNIVLQFSKYIVIFGINSIRLLLL